MALRIDQRDIGAVKVLDLSGKLAGDAADALWDRIDDLLDAGHAKLILNLGGVSFIDSAALGGLLSKRAAVVNAGGQLKLLNLSERVWDSDRDRPPSSRWCSTPSARRRTPWTASGRAE